jgi:RNA polymerase sigma factor (sigma-70 family)
MDYKNEDDIRAHLMADEAESMQGILVGDRKTVKFLYETLGPKIVGYVLNNSGSRDDGQEVFQNTILRIFQNLKTGNYTHTGKFVQYFFTVAINVWHEELRHRKRQTHEEAMPVLKDNSMDDYEQAVLKDEKLNALHTALQKIGEKCRELLQKFHFEDKPSKELAAEYQVADNIIRKRLFDCREKLRQSTLAEMKK